MAEQETVETTEETVEQTSETDTKADAKHKALLADLAKERREKKALTARLQELEDAGKTELQKANERAEEAVKAAQTHETAALKLQVAFDKGLTAAQAKRLVGGSKEELEADADEILRDFAAAKRPAGDIGQGARGTSATQSPRDAFAALFQTK